LRTHRLSIGFAPSIACLAFLAVAPSLAGAASLPYAVRAWTIEDGLPTSTVQDVAQTPDGYLWLSTTGGLARFDGVRFRSFGLAQGLPTNRFQGLAVDRKGALWISSEDGTLFRWDGHTFTQQPTGSSREAPALLALPDGSILGAGFQQYWLRNGRQGNVRQDSTTAAVLDANGTVWLTAQGGAPARLEGDHVVAVGPCGSLGDRWIVDLRDGTVRFFRQRGSDAELLDTRLERVAFLPRAARENVQWIDRQGQLWSLGGDGLVVRDADSGSVIGTLSLGLTVTLGKLFLDRQDNIWVGTWQQGLFRVARSPLVLLRPDGVIGPLAFRSAIEDRTGRVVAWDGLDRMWSVDGGTLRPIPSSMGDTMRYGTARTTFRNVWQRLEFTDSSGAGGVIEAVEASPPTIIVDPQHPLSAAVNDEAGVRYISAAPGQPAERRLLPQEPTSRDVLFDRAGRLWVATVSGLWRLAPGDSQHFGRKDGLPADHLRQLHEDRDGVLWIGTYGAGLVRMKDGKFATLDRSHGLLEDVVSTVLEDDDGNLWLGGNAGIQRVSRSQANACLDGKIARVVAVGYGRDAGLRNPEGTGFPGYRSRDGRLWFGTFDGLAVIDPRLVRGAASAAPTPVVEELHAGGRALPGFTLAAGQRRFEIHFTGIDLRAPEQLRFRYRLDGVDRDWIDAGNSRVATYTNVPPGRHRFHLLAINGDGVASPAPAEAELVVEPRLWERLPVQALGLLLVLLLVAGAWRWRSARLVADAAALQRAVDERTAEVVEAKSRIETALTTVGAQASRLEVLDRARSRFFASVSHEFRTPLTLIQGPLEDVTRGEHGALPDGAREQVDIALASATRLHRLVDQLLDAARAEAGELRLERVPGELTSFLTELAQAFAPLAERKRIAFEYRFPQRALVASFDPFALEKVFANLLGNAFKFTPEGGHVWWRAAAVDDGSAIEIAVVDDGPGIAGEDLPHIFKHFYRSERSVTREQPGTGLGLALAHDMVVQHGGTLRVESSEGQGCTFTVRLPLLTGAAIPAPAPALDAAAATALADEIRIAPEEHASAATKAVAVDAPLVLVVEDNPDVRAYVARRLGRHYRVAEATDGEQALARMREVVPDLVVSDLAMPGMDGLALCRAVREDPELEFVPVILLTAAAETESRVRGLEGGADDYVTKPFEMRELLARIARMLQSRRRLRDHLARAAATEAMLGTAAPAPAPGESKADSAFARRIKEVVAARLGDEDFGVDELAEGMGMGRTLLYQRTRDLLGATPMELLMTRRLERAAELLAAGEGNVGEVAYAVGFRSVAHFTHRFRERFSVTPSAWRRGARPIPNDDPATH
jgi:signal transduction histidine kinase/DNA-binding response OmpR family regulator/ligand-binding sensor domain-containing protein